MGNRSSRTVRVEARLSLVGEGRVDAIRMSRPRSPGCCGKGRRSIASFTFPKGTEGGAKPLASEQAASLKVGRLAAKDPETPIRVECLAGDRIVFCQEMTLRDLLAGVRRTTARQHAVLFLCLARGQGVRGGQGCPVLFCNGKRVGSRPDPPVKAQAAPVPKAGQDDGPAEAGLVGASPGQEACSTEAGLVGASPGQEACPAEAGQVGASPGQEAGPAEAGQVVASPGQEAGPAEAGQVGASPGQEAGSAAAGQVGASPEPDGLGLWVSVPSPGEGQEGKEDRSAKIPAVDEGAGLVHRTVGKGETNPSPPPQREPRRSGRTGQGRVGGRGRLSLDLLDSLLSIGHTLTLITLAYSTLQEYFPD